MVSKGLPKEVIFKQTPEWNKRLDQLKIWRVYQLELYVHVELLSHIWLFATPWAVACQVPLSKGFFQARILKKVAISSSQGIFLTEGSNVHLLCLLRCRQVLYYWVTGVPGWGEGKCKDSEKETSSAWSRSSEEASVGGAEQAKDKQEARRKSERGEPRAWRAF